MIDRTVEAHTSGGPTPEDGQARRSVKTKADRWRSSLPAIALAAPAVLLVAGVYLYPAVATVVYSVTHINISSYTIEGFAGATNFIAVFTDEAFMGALGRTMYFGVMVVFLTITPSFLIAVLLNQPFWGRTVLRVVVLLPWAVPPVVSGVLWGQMFQPEFGFINKFLGLIGLPSDVVWLADPVLALHAVMVAEVWRWVPFATLFLLAALQTVPRGTLEAASVDGANAWRRLVHIALPQIVPMLAPIAIFMFVWAMKAFDTIFVLTRGGPADATTTLNYLVYEEGFERFRFGEAAALAWILTLLTVAAIGLISLGRRAYIKRAQGLPA